MWIRRKYVSNEGLWIVKRHFELSTEVKDLIGTAGKTLEKGEQQQTGPWQTKEEKEKVLMVIMT